MLKFKYNKLVRDRIVDHLITSGTKVEYRILNDDEHKAELVRKLNEEVAEVLKAKPENIAAEIADVQQAIDDLAAKFGVTAKEIAVEQKLKNDKNGPFKKGLFIDYVE